MDTKLTHCGMSIGAPEYMAPEGFVGSLVSPRSDVYSLGCTLYALFTGRPPFLEQRFGGPRRGTPDEGPLSAVFNSQARSLSKFGGHCPAVSGQDPSDRFRDCAEMLEALQRVQDLPRWEPEHAVAFWDAHRPANALAALCPTKAGSFGPGAMGPVEVGVAEA